MEEMKHLYKCSCHTNMCKSLQRTLEANEEIMITATFAAVPTRLPFHSEIFTLLYVVYTCNNARYTNLESVKRCKTRKNSNHNTDISLTWRDERILADDNDKWKTCTNIYKFIFKCDNILCLCMSIWKIYECVPFQTENFFLVPKRKLEKSVNVVLGLFL